jgi:hypothetical protein
MYGLFVSFTIVNSCAYISKDPRDREDMATDPVCGMFVEEKPDFIQHTVVTIISYASSINGSLRLSHAC